MTTGNATAIVTVVVGNDPLARGGLVSSLSPSEAVEVAEHVAPGDLHRALLASAPDAIIWDLGPQGDGSEISADLDLPVLALVGDPEVGPRALRGPVLGLLLREADMDTLGAALWAITHGLITVDEALAEAVLARSQSEHPELVEVLTPREVDVLGWLAEGLTNRAIARRLDISEHTVKFHVNAILWKLNAHSRTEAVVRATRMGLLQL